MNSRQIAMVSIVIIFSSAYVQGNQEERKKADSEAESINNAHTYTQKNENNEKINSDSETTQKEKDTNTLDRYQASEEISEDLSVSYPVDI